MIELMCALLMLSTGESGVTSRGTSTSLDKLRRCAENDGGARRENDEEAEGLPALVIELRPGPTPEPVRSFGPSMAR